MYVGLNLKTVKFYLIKLATDFYWQPSYILGERSSFLPGVNALAYFSEGRVTKRKSLVTPAAGVQRDQRHLQRRRLRTVDAAARRNHPQVGTAFLMMAYIG